MGRPLVARPAFSAALLTIAIIGVGAAAVDGNVAMTVVNGGFVCVWSVGLWWSLRRG